MSRFDQYLTWLTGPNIEGGYGNDPIDRGGATNKGITQASYDSWLTARDLPTRPVREITDFEVHSIYRVRYWGACRCEDLPPPLDMVVCDAAVQHGVGRAVKWLQELVAAQVDGICGEKTLYAVKGYVLANGVTELIDTYMDHRAAFYAVIIARDPTQRRFKKGWANRMNALQEFIS